jgi:hypothetical protein
MAVGEYGRLFTLIPEPDSQSHYTGLVLYAELHSRNLLNLTPKEQNGLFQISFTLQITSRLSLSSLG